MIEAGNSFKESFVISVNVGHNLLLFQQNVTSVMLVQRPRSSEVAKLR